MHCPECQSPKTSVYDSRVPEKPESYSVRRVPSTYGENFVYRRRRCQVCGRRWTTFEVPAEALDTVVAHLKRLSRLKQTIKALRRETPETLSP